VSSFFSNNAVMIAVICALVAVVYGVLLIRWLLALPAGDEKMREVAGAVQEGAKAYLGRQYRTIAIVGVVVFVILGVALGAKQGWGLGWETAAGFVVGASLSAAAGYIGMMVSVRVNVRTAEAAKKGLGPALSVAFRGGSVTGLLVVGLALFGVAVYYWLGTQFWPEHAVRALIGLGFGGSLISVFARVGGGIFTKAADVGADLVGKLEAGIPEDDPRNPAVIADNVGDNVGDCAGMAADLFESYAVTLVASLILGSSAFGVKGLIFPLIVPALGVLTAIIGVYITKARQGENGLTTITRSFYISAVISAVLCTVAAFAYLPKNFQDLGVDSVRDQSGNPALIASVAVIIGIVLAGVILWLTGYFTGTHTKPTNDVARSSLTGAATVILAGISVGFESAVYTALVIAAAVYGAYLLSGSVIVALFMIALAGCGLLTTVGVIVAMDTFGPVSDNAQGVAEMSGDVSPQGAQILTELDAVGNTTKAITKGIAIATAVLAATALFGSYSDAIGQALIAAGERVGVFTANVVSPNTLVGMLLGACVVFMFSGLAVNAVARAAGAVVMEVRKQFHDHPGIMDGTERPEYGRVVDICTRDSLRELATPGLLAVFAPIAVGFGLGVGPLAGYLAGCIATGTLMAVFLANSGGSWDNAKKIVEDGNFGGKGSLAHEATIIGDTVGDPFKDTAGPAINPLLKVMNLVSLLIAPAVVTLTVGSSANDGIRYGIAIASVVVIVGAVLVSKRRAHALHAEEPLHA